MPSIDSSPALELKQLPCHLKYVYLGENDTLPSIISSLLDSTQDDLLMCVLKKHKKVMGWQMVNIKGISPTICIHKILLEDISENKIESQRRLNPIMKEVVKKENIKWLDIGIVYPI